MNQERERRSIFSPSDAYQSYFVPPHELTMVSFWIFAAGQSAVSAGW